MATAKEVAAHLDISPQYYTTLKRRGIFPPSKGHGAIDIDACRINYIRHLRGLRSGEHNSSPDQINLTAERARKERAMAEKTEFDLSVAKKQYIHVSVVENKLERFASAVASRLDAIRSRLKVKYPDLTTAHIDGITKEIAEARNEIADYRPSSDSAAA